MERDSEKIILKFKIAQFVQTHLERPMINEKWLEVLNSTGMWKRYHARERQ
jgi:hypothetical protein